MAEDETFKPFMTKIENKINEAMIKSLEKKLRPYYYENEIMVEKEALTNIIDRHNTGVTQCQIIGRDKTSKFDDTTKGILLGCVGSPDHWIFLIIY